MFVINIENLKTLKYHLFLKKIDLFVVYSKSCHEYEKAFKIKFSWCSY